MVSERGIYLAMLALGNLVLIVLFCSILLCFSVSHKHIHTPYIMNDIRISCFNQIAILVKSLFVLVL